jgi:hypothetical protein
MFNFGDPDLIAQIDRHITRSAAPVACVFHEIVSDELHIDIHHVVPDGKRRSHALITSGMSALPMNTGKAADEWRFAELCILLDPSWKVDAAAFEDERHYWPIRLLKGLTRYPRENDTHGCIDGGHGSSADHRCGEPRPPLGAHVRQAACVAIFGTR